MLVGCGEWDGECFVSKDFIKAKVERTPLIEYYEEEPIRSELIPETRIIVAHITKETESKYFCETHRGWSTEFWLDKDPNKTLEPIRRGSYENTYHLWEDGDRVLNGKLVDKNS
jgi:hypothetical protein